jgi:hypothetical protein
MNSASFETEDSIAGDASTQADNFNQTGAEPLNGNGFYRFKIGDFQATVISDGQGPIPVRPIFVMNASEAELAPVLRGKLHAAGDPGNKQPAGGRHGTGAYPCRHRLR